MARRRCDLTLIAVPAALMRLRAVAFAAACVASAGASAQLQLPTPVGAGDGAIATEEGGLPPQPPRFGVTRITPSIDSRLVYTDNPGPDQTTGRIHSDTVLEVQPSIAFERHGPRVTLVGNLAVSSINYLQGSRTDRVLPRGRVDLGTKLVENLIYFDAYARVDPTFEDPFVTRPGDGTSYKLEPRTRYAVSPYLLKRFGDRGSLLIRTDYSDTRITDQATQIKSHAKSLDHTVTAEASPQPLGGSLELRSHDESDDQLDANTIQDRTARAWLTFAFDPQVSIGVDAGRERTEFPGSIINDSFYGGRIYLRPTERTNVRLTVEKRYFGTGWDFSADHRSPYFSLTVQSGRLVSSQDIPEFAFGSGANIATSLDAMLTTQIPNAADRQREVDRIIAARNLPTTATSSLTLYSTVPSLRQNAQVNLSLLGRRNLIYVQYGYLKVLALPGTTLIANPANSDILQQAVAVGWNLRLTPLATANLIAEMDRTERLSGANTGQYTEQRSVRGEVVYTLTPHSSATVGARKLGIRASAGFLNANDLVGENAVYLGFRYRF